MSNYRFFLSLLLKFVGLVLLFLSIGYWIRLVGISDPSIGFDTLPVHWRIAGSALVILMPIAALGLWGSAKWGLIVWFFVVAIETVMYGLYPNLFGQAPTVLLFHLVTVLTFLLGQGLIMLLEQRHIRRTQAQT